MENYMKQITPDMIRTVDDLKRREFKDATPEEIETYAQWSRINALQDAEFQHHREVRERESKARKESYEAQAKSAIDALNALADLAKAKLEAVENG